MLTKLMRLLARVPAWWQKRGRKGWAINTEHVNCRCALPERNPDGTYGESEIEPIVWGGVQVLHGWTFEDDWNADEADD